MTPADLQRYLHEHIPLSAAMEVGVAAITAESVTLTAPLGPNINHRATVFGGSASAVAILSCWSLLYLRLLAEGIECRLVIQHNAIDYIAPIEGDFTATARLSAVSEWPAFLRMLTRKGRARIAAESTLTFRDRVAGRLTGSFVALPRE